jgi:hypothetical protein
MNAAFGTDGFRRKVSREQGLCQPARSSTVSKHRCQIVQMEVCRNTIQVKNRLRADFVRQLALASHGLHPPTPKAEVTQPLQRIVR